MKSWAKRILDANDIYKKQIQAAPIVKSKKGRIWQAKYSFTILLNTNNIENMDELVGNTK